MSPLEVAATLTILFIKKKDVLLQIFQRNAASFVLCIWRHKHAHIHDLWRPLHAHVLRLPRIKQRLSRRPNEKIKSESAELKALVITTLIVIRQESVDNVDVQNKKKSLRSRELEEGYGRVRRKGAKNAVEKKKQIKIEEQRNGCRLPTAMLKYEDTLLCQ